jgi:hypothetical protein
MRRKILKIFSISFLTLTVFFLLYSACAAEKDLEVNYPEVLGTKPTTAIPEYVKYIFTFSILVVGLVAFGSLVLGGMRYLSSAGDPSKMRDAREQILSAVLGIIILLSSYLILYNINPYLINIEITPLGEIEEPEKPPPFEIENEKVSLILEELPLGQAMKNGVWEEAKTKALEKFIKNFEDFLNKEIKVEDSELNNTTFKKISDLNKYLTTVTDACHCANLLDFCTKPGSGSRPVGCKGDVCQTDQGNGIEEDSPRAKINRALDINKDKLKELLEFRKQFIEYKKSLRERLRNFQEIEAGIISCKSQNQELISQREYLDVKDEFEKEKKKVVTINNYLDLEEPLKPLAPQDDKLTFYCSSGGTVFDYPYSVENIEFEPEYIAASDMPEFAIEKISCPFKFNVGENLDKLREFAIIDIVKLERIILLIEEMTKEIQEMAELVSQCNDQECEAKCGCVPNPCYHNPHPFCSPFFEKRCLQAIGGCQGTACPSEKIKEKSIEIKETETKIFETIEEIKLIFPEVSLLLTGEAEKREYNAYNLSNFNISVGVCDNYSSPNADTGWFLSTCEQALGNFGPNNQLISVCNPRDFFCCSSSEQSNPPKFPSVIGKTPAYIIPPSPEKDLEPLPSKDNCPEGWLCSGSVTNYNQYENDASEPLKQLIACMRQKLDILQEQEELEENEIIGKIISISDSKLYEGTCSWESGPNTEGGCSYLFETKNGKKRISAHYGGTDCRHRHKSYAIDIGISEDIQKKYIDEIIDIAKECSPNAYVLDEITNVHIDIGEIYGCGSTDQ